MKRIWLLLCTLAAAPAAAAPPEVCAGRTPCRVVEEVAAGDDARGRSLSVVKLALFAEGRPDAGVPGGDCEAYEQWLVARQKGTVVEKTRLVSVCNDGYGASGVGEDAFEVKRDWFHHQQYGGSAWRWANDLVLGLSPLRRRVEASQGYWNLGPNFSNVRWSWDDFAGRHAWFAPVCGKEDALGDNVEIGGGDLDRPPAHAHLFTPIPKVTLEASYRSGGWRTADLGRCSAAADFVVHGKPDAAGDASLRVVAAAEGELYLEVRDDRLIGPSARWLGDDHLEVWVSPEELPGYMDPCITPSKKLRQWGIRVADGTVFPAHGKPATTALKVERAAAAGATRFKLTLPADAKAVTIAYSDSDGEAGKKQDLMIATSKFSFATHATLGDLVPIAAADATCRVTGGKLEPVVQAPYTAPPP